MKAAELGICVNHCFSQSVKLKFSSGRNSTVCRTFNTPVTEKEAESNTEVNFEPSILQPQNAGDQVAE